MSLGAEYWIVDPDARLVERWHPGDTRPAIHSEEIVWSQSDGHDALRIDLDRLFADALDR
jgi:hypothetical protein